MRIFPVSVLTSLALIVGTQAWAQQSQAPAPLSKQERIELCKKKMGVPLDPAESPPVRTDGADGKVSRPTILHQVPPRGVGGHGRVVVESVIDEDGCVRQAKILQSAGPDMDAAAVTAIQQWVFLPATGMAVQ